MNLKPMTKREKLLRYLAAQIRKHRQLDRQVTAEQRRPAPDAPMLKALKRKRLAVKDRIAQLKAAFRQVRTTEKSTLARI